MHYVLEIGFTNQPEPQQGDYGYRSEDPGRLNFTSCMMCGLQYSLYKYSYELHDAGYFLVVR